MPSDVAALGVLSTQENQTRFRRDEHFEVLVAVALQENLVIPIQEPPQGNFRGRGTPATQVYSSSQVPECLVNKLRQCGPIFRIERRRIRREINPDIPEIPR